MLLSTVTHKHTDHGVESLLQLLLLLEEQSAGHTFPLAVTASRGEETRQQHHQAPQRDLHRSAHPDRQGQTGAQQVENGSHRVKQQENLGNKAYGIWVQSTGRKQIE